MISIKLKDYEITTFGFGKVWVRTDSGEGSEFPTEAIEQVLYEALDKYYKANF